MRIQALSIFSLILLLFFSCGGETPTTDGTPKPAPKSMIADEADPMDNLGIGPITEAITLPETIDEALVTKGIEVYEAKCTACHKPDKKFIGPAPAGILPFPASCSGASCLASRAHNRNPEAFCAPPA